VETTDSGTVDNTTTDDGAIEADDTADPAAAAINSQTATQPVFSGAVTSDKNGNNTDGLVSPGGKITLTGSGLSAYSSFALQIDGKVYSITQANISSNQAVLTVPLNLPGTIQTGDVVLVQASSTVQGVASGVLNLSFNYQAPSAAADLDTGADTDVETADSGDTAAAAGDSDVESTDTADNASTSTGDSDVETADSDTASGTTAQYASSHNVSSGVSAFGVVDGMAGLQMPTGYSASGDNGLQMSSGDEELQDSEDVEVSADDSQGQGPAAQGSRQSAQQGAQGSYTVKGGDTLWNIAKKYYGNGSKWRTILEANPNCLSRPGDTRTLKIGAQLVIPKV
jgi:nucleoid-associated protein YgaU